MAARKQAGRLLFLIILFLLYLTSYPSTGWWDSGEYASNAFNLSIPGPGGSILFVLLGRFFIILFFFLPAVKAVILVSIFSAALASVFAYYTLLTIFDNLSIKSSAEFKISSAFFTSLSVPFLFSVWCEAAVTRIYALGLLLTGILIYSSVKIWLSNNDDEKIKLFYLVIFILGLDYAAHRLNTPFIPVTLLLLFSLKHKLKSFKFWFAVAGLYLLGFSLNLFILIRSQANPPFAMDSIHNFNQLFDWINMKRFGESNFSIIFNRRAPFWNYQINHMYLRYFGWNFLGSQGSGTIFNETFISVVPFLLGITGFFYSLLKKFKIWILIFTAFFFFSFGLIVYSNIREGFDHFREIDRLFIPSFFVFVLWIGIGLYYSAGIFRNFLTRLSIKKTYRLIIISLLAFVLLPLNIIWLNWFKCNRSGYYFPEDFAFNMLAGCSRNAMLFTNGDNDTFPLWFLQSVEGIRPDIAVMNLGLLNTTFFVHQLQREYHLFHVNQDIFNPDKFAPSKIDSPIVLKIPVKNPVSLITDTITSEYSGRSFGNVQGLMPQDKSLISLLKNNRIQKSAYFAVTVNNQNLIGLSSYLSSTGIVNLLTPFKGDSILPIQLKSNLLKKYRYRNFNNRKIYTDRVTNNLFDNYRRLFIQLSQYYWEKGDKEEAKNIIDAMNLKLPRWRFTKQQNRYVDNFTARFKND